MGVRLGNEVGYSVRFEDCTPAKTIIQYMLDESLLRDIYDDPDLKRYSVVIVDDVHGRSTATDIVLALVKKVVAGQRKDLKLLISSSSLDVERFRFYFEDALTMAIYGEKEPPVEVIYKAPQGNYLHDAITMVLDIHTTLPCGDILLFLTGQQEIEEADKLLRQRIRAPEIKNIMIHHIYANSPREYQSYTFESTPGCVQKVVLATNLPETIPIAGIKYVIDPDF